MNMKVHITSNDDSLLYYLSACSVVVWTWKINVRIGEWVKLLYLWIWEEKQRKEENKSVIYELKYVSGVQKYLPTVIQEISVRNKQNKNNRRVKNGH